MLLNNSNSTNSEQHPFHIVNLSLWPIMTSMSLLCLTVVLFSYFWFNYSAIVLYLTQVTQACVDNAWEVSTCINFYWLEHAGINQLYIMALCFFWGVVFAVVMSFFHNKLHTCTSIVLMLVFWCFSACLWRDSLFYIFFLEFAGGFSFFGILIFNSVIFNTWNGGEGWTDFFSNLQCPWFFCRVLFGVLLIQNCFMIIHIYLFLFFGAVTSVNFCILFYSKLGFQSPCIQSEVFYLLSAGARPLFFIVSTVCLLLYSIFGVSGSLLLGTGNAILALFFFFCFGYHTFKFDNSMWTSIIGDTLPNHVLYIGYFTLGFCLFVSLDGIQLAVWIFLTLLIFICLLYKYTALFKSLLDGLGCLTGTGNDLGASGIWIWSNILIFSFNILTALVFLGVLNDVLLNCWGVGDIIHVYQTSHNHMDNLFWDLYSGNINKSEYDLKMTGASPRIPVKSFQDIAFNYILLGLELFCYLQAVLVLMDLN